MMAKSQMRGDALKSGNRGDTKIAGESISLFYLIFFPSPPTIVIFF
jgi:hypothetical protein